jgi:hypothetical protein
MNTVRFVDLDNLVGQIRDIRNSKSYTRSAHRFKDFMNSQSCG